MGVQIFWLQLQISVAVVCIFLLCRAMKKMPKIYAYFLWLLVFARLLCPVSVESRFSFMPSRQAGKAWVEEVLAKAGNLAIEGGFWNNSILSGTTDGQEGMTEESENESMSGVAFEVMDGIMSGAGAENSETMSGAEVGSIGGMTSGTALGATGDSTTGTGLGATDDSMTGTGLGTTGNSMTGTGLGTTGDSMTGTELGAIDDLTGTTFGNQDESMSGAAPGVTNETGNDIMQEWILLLWGIGVVAVLGYNGAALVALRRKLKGAQLLEQNAPDVFADAERRYFIDRQGGFGKKSVSVYISEHISSPFALGMFRPQIYLPANLAKEEQVYILAHEQVHIRRKDYLVKNLVFLLTALYWFNPFVWVAFFCLERDMEMSCDEKVIKLMGTEIKRSYSQSLLNFAIGKGGMAVTPLTFGENNVKQRVKNVLIYKRARKWSVAVGAVLILVGMVALFTTGQAANEESGKDREQVVVNEGDTAGNENTAGGSAAGEENATGGSTAGNENTADGSAAEDENATGGSIAGEENTADGSAAREENATGGSIVGNENTTDRNATGNDNAIDEDIIGGENQADNGKNGGNDAADIFLTEEVTLAEDGETLTYTVQVRRDGIYRLQNDTEECIYPYPIVLWELWDIDDGILYFFTDTTYREGKLDYADNAIVMVDIKTGQYDMKTLSMSVSELIPFLIDCDEMIVNGGMIKLYDRDRNKSYSRSLLNTGESAVLIGNYWQGKAVSELNQQEQDAYGVWVRKQLLENGEVLKLSNREKKDTYTLVDLDGDGKAERITLSRNPAPLTDLYWTYGSFDKYKLDVNGSTLTGELEGMANDIYAFSPDGKNIVLALSAASAEGQYQTALYSYVGGQLKELGILPIHISDCVLKDGYFGSWVRFEEFFQPGWIFKCWCINKEGQLEEVLQDSYQLSYSKSQRSNLLVTLPVHDTPGGEEIHYIQPQSVDFVRINNDFLWIYLEAEDGSSGWFQIETNRIVENDVPMLSIDIVELDMSHTEVFELFYAG